MTINNVELAGVRMGEGFRNELLAPPELKDFVTNESRLEHGMRIIVRNPRYASRTLSLEFQVTGSTKVAMEQNLAALYAQLATGTVRLAVPELTSAVFNLVYTGKTPSYSAGVSGRACKVKVGFLEPNPANRT